MIIWFLRGNDPAKSFGGGANDKLVARGELGRHFARLSHRDRCGWKPDFPCSMHRSTAGCRCRGLGLRRRQVLVDELIVATGFRPDLSILSEIRLRLDPASKHRSRLPR